MKDTILPVELFLSKSENKLLIDVRSPDEYLKGHIPEAVNIPLFSNSARAEIGTLYKNKGREAAVLKGLELIGPKLSDLLTSIIKLKNDRNCEEVFIHCWRGGLRSSSFAWMLELAGIKTYILEGGYKAYRNKVLSVFDQKYKIVLLSGETGCGKTDILKELEASGEQIIDLEGLAHHKGSVFGDVGQEKQPTAQQFENDLARALTSKNTDQWIWFENESPAIGFVYIPKAIISQMKEAPVVQISLPKDIRENRIIREYGHLDFSKVVHKIDKLKKYLGGKNHSAAISGIQTGELHTTVDILLGYYDKTYTHYRKKYNTAAACYLTLSEDNPVKNAMEIKKQADKTIF